MALTNYVEQKVVFITGGASGFGFCLAKKCIELGAKVILTDIDQDAIKKALDQISAPEDAIIGLPCDVTDVEQVRQTVQEALKSYSRIDVMVNNAGVMPLAFFADHTTAYHAWDACIDINFKGVLHGIIAVYDQMIAQGSGQVINISSIYSNFPVAGGGVYGATKAAVNFLSESLRVESQGRIKVTNVRPTGVPGTALADGIVNPAAVVGILGQNMAAYQQMLQAHPDSDVPAEHTTADSIELLALDPEHVADQIVYAINQPLGVSVGDITVRASGDAYIL